MEHILFLNNVLFDFSNSYNSVVKDRTTTRQSIDREQYIINSMSLHKLFLLLLYEVFYSTTYSHNNYKCMKKM